MNNKEIQEIALRSGFKLNGETDGVPDLKPYVYHFAKEIAIKAKAMALSDIGKAVDDQQLLNIEEFHLLKDEVINSKV